MLTASLQDQVLPETGRWQWPQRKTHDAFNALSRQENALRISKTRLRVSSSLQCPSIVSQNICSKQTKKINRFLTAFLWRIPENANLESTKLCHSGASNHYQDVAVFAPPVYSSPQSTRPKTRLNSNPRITKVGSSDANIHCQSIRLSGKYCFENEPRKAIRLATRKLVRLGAHSLHRASWRRPQKRTTTSAWRTTKRDRLFFPPTLHKHSTVF